MNYTLTRSKNRHRSLALKVTTSGEIIVRAPLYLPKFFIDRFVKEHEKWIFKQQIVNKLPHARKKKYFASLAKLEQYLSQLLDKYTALTNLYPSSFRLRQVSSYWGSCSPKGVLSFNTRLLYVPPSCVEYLVIHELIHLKYRGHGKRFWNLVKKYYPNLDKPRQILRLLKN